MLNPGLSIPIILLYNSRIKTASLSHIWSGFDNTCPVICFSVEKSKKVYLFFLKITCKKHCGML